MTRSKTLPGILFVFFLAVFGLIIGTMIGGAFFVPEGSGLAGPAIALGYGALGALTAIVAGIILVGRMSYETLRKALLFSSVIFVIAILALVFRARSLSEQQNAQPQQKISPNPTQPQGGFGAILSPKTARAAQRYSQDNSIGLGMISPPIKSGNTFYFYSAPDFSNMADQMTPIDSLTFSQGEHFVEISYAPPWFWPEVMKLDYNLLLLRAKTLSRNWVEVVVNKQTGQTAWIDRLAAEFAEWPVFVLNTFAVEAIDPANNPLRTKPLNHASPVQPPLSSRAQLRPLAIQNNWLRVAQILEGQEKTPTGWIRWRNEEQLLVRYSLLN